MGMPSLSQNFYSGYDIINYSVNCWGKIWLPADKVVVGELLHISSGSAHGIGKVTPEGFVVFTRSQTE